MKQHELTQGSAEWLAYRKEHFNASDAPAMMGCSAYKTRSQLLRELHTGLTPDVDAGTQRRFDAGHRFEALARPLAEAIIGEELYPVVGSTGRFSASFDGLTMLEDTAFEHKTLNDELRACMTDEGNGYGLPLQYQVQMEQQLLVSGAERVLFMASKWEGDTLTEKRHCWYASNAKLRAQIVAGWSQFALDLAAYQPEEAPAPAAVGRAPETLPALRIEVTGMVTASNIAEFKATALGVIKSVNRDLKTDQDFADNAKAIRWCSDIEGRVKAAKEHALGQTASIDELFRAMDEISTEARAVRLELERLDKARKEAVRGEIVAGGVSALREHMSHLNVRLGNAYMPAISADFAGAVKGKRTISSLHDAVDTELARAKIEANSMADRISLNLATLRELARSHLFLFADTPHIVVKATDDFEMLVTSRIAEHQAKEAARIEAETARIRAEVEQQERAKAEHKARILAEEVASAERKRAALEFIAKADADLLAVQARAKADAAAAELMAELPAAVEVLQPLQFGGLAVTQAQFDKTYPVKMDEPDSGEVMTLSQIGERLGFLLPASFLRSLGLEPSGRDKKRPSAVLYREQDFEHICAVLIDHISSVCATQAA